MRLDRDLTLAIVSIWPATPKQDCMPILMYHSISDVDENAAPYYRLKTSPRRFAEQMQWMSDAGYAGVSLEQGLQFLDGSRRSDRIPVAITFDDGFEDFYTTAWPILEHHGFTATMYLPTGFVGTGAGSFLNQLCLTWNEVRELRKHGIRFGSHTVSHCVLKEMPFSSIALELKVSKECIEEALCERVIGFAYPYAFPQEDGRFSARLAGQLRECGYESCVTTVIGRARPEDDRFCLKRLPINSCDDRDLFMAKLNGSYDWVGSVQRTFRRVKHTFACVKGNGKANLRPT